MNKSGMKQERGNLLRKVRIIVSDPYATDDSSGDEWFESKPPKVKRIVHEISLPFHPSKSSQNCCGGVKTSRRKASVQLTKPVGVRLRKSGKWAAEIRNPFTKTRVWLGTYETSEEAEKAYADKKVEFDDALASSVTAASSSVNSQCLRSSVSASGSCVNADDVLSKEKMSLSVDDTVSGDSTKEDFGFFELEIPDLSFLAAEEESTVSGANGADLDFDWFLKDEDSGHLFDDFSLLDNDISISEIGNSVPSELPDFDFTDVEVVLGDMNFAFVDQLAPLNIACP